MARPFDYSAHLTQEQNTVNYLNSPAGRSRERATAKKTLNDAARATLLAQTGAKDTGQSLADLSHQSTGTNASPQNSDMGALKNGARPAGWFPNNTPRNPGNNATLTRPMAAQMAPSVNLDTAKMATAAAANPLAPAIGAVNAVAFDAATIKPPAQPTAPNASFQPTVNGAKLNHTGAGWFDDQGHAVQLNAMQAMDAETNGAWSGWNAQQRADYLRKRGTSAPQGSVVDSGVNKQINPQGFITSTTQTPTGDVVSGMSPAEMRQTELQYASRDSAGFPMPVTGSVRQPVATARTSTAPAAASAKSNLFAPNQPANLPAVPIGAQQNQPASRPPTAADLYAQSQPTVTPAPSPAFAKNDVNSLPGFSVPTGKETPLTPATNDWTNHPIQTFNAKLPGGTPGFDSEMEKLRARDPNTYGIARFGY